MSGNPPRFNPNAQSFRPNANAQAFVPGQPFQVNYQGNQGFGVPPPQFYPPGQFPQYGGNFQAHPNFQQQNFPPNQFYGQQAPPPPNVPNANLQQAPPQQPVLDCKNF